MLKGDHQVADETHFCSEKRIPAQKQTRKPCIAAKPMEGRGDESKMGTATEQQPPPTANESTAPRESAVRAERRGGPRTAPAPSAARGMTAFRPPGEPNAAPRSPGQLPPLRRGLRSAETRGLQHLCGDLVWNSRLTDGRTLRAALRALRGSGEAAPTARTARGPSAPPGQRCGSAPPAPLRHHSPPLGASKRRCRPPLPPRPFPFLSPIPHSRSPHPAPRPLPTPRQWRRCGRRFPAPRPPPTVRGRGTPRHRAPPRHVADIPLPPTHAHPPYLSAALPHTHTRTRSAPAQHSAAAGARPAGRGGAARRGVGEGGVGGGRLCGCSRGAAAALHPPPRPARSLPPSGARRRLAGARAQGRAEGAGKKRAGPRSPPGRRGKGTAGAPPGSLPPFVPAMRAEVRRAGRMGIHEGAWLCKARPLSSAGAGRGHNSEWAWPKAASGRGSAL